MRARLLFSFVVGSLTLGNLGCGWFGAGQPSGGVAVVDLDEIARQVGADGEIAQAVEAREANLNSQLQVMKASYVKQLKERKQLYGETPTEDQSKQLVSINRQINLNLVSAQQKAASHLSTHRSELIMKFREQVGPVAEEIARQKGLSVVVPKNDGWLLAVDENVDITNEVAATLKTQWKPIVHQVSTPATSPVDIGNGHVAEGHSPTPNGSGGVQPASHWDAPPSVAPQTP